MFSEVLSLSSGQRLVLWRVQTADWMRKISFHVCVVLTVVTVSDSYVLIHCLSLCIMGNVNETMHAQFAKGLLTMDLYESLWLSRP